MKLGISLAVHQNWDVVQDQLVNIETFLPGAWVALHVSQSLTDPLPTYFSHPRVLVNPIQQPTRWGTGFLLRVHLANFALLEKTGIDMFLMSASNELLVRPGLARYLNRFDAGVERFWLNPRQPDKWAFQIQCQKDAVFQALRERHRIKTIFCSSVEGSFYRASIFTTLRDRLAGFEIPVLEYPQEEAYFATLTQDLIGRRARPICYLNFAASLQVSQSDVDYIRRHRRSPPLPNKNTPLTRWKIWAGEIWNRVGKEKFSVKRVAREVHDPLRTYIRSLQLPLTVRK